MSQYAKEIKHILATLNEQGDEQDTALPDEEEPDTIHVYPVEGGGILFTRIPLEPDEAAPPIIDSQDDHDASTTAAKSPPIFVLFLLLLCLFVVGDVADTQLIALMTPTVTTTADLPATVISAHTGQGVSPPGRHSPKLACKTGDGNHAGAVRRNVPVPDQPATADHAHRRTTQTPRAPAAEQHSRYPTRHDYRRSR